MVFYLCEVLAHPIQTKHASMYAWRLRLSVRTSGFTHGSRLVSVEGGGPSPWNPVSHGHVLESKYEGGHERAC